MKNWSKVFMLTALAVFAASAAYGTTDYSKKAKDEEIQDKNTKCINCHLKENRSLVLQWENSPHAAAEDGRVGCYNCHAANPDDDLAYKHEGVVIKTIQTPKDCGYCHEDETKEMTNSHHATAGQIMASLDNVLAEVICSMEDKADAVNGCWQCHGSVVKVMKDEKGEPMLNENEAVMIDPKTWPNTGIGRINPDGTKGACMACHSKHSFRSSVARQPDNCGKCHMGPDHPQKEVYEESKHGIAYNALPRGDGQNEMNILKDGKWVLGKHYYNAPTCTTCHMGAYVKKNGAVEPASHNVGDRISWNLRAKVSPKMNRAIFNDGTVKDIPGDIPPRPGQKKEVIEYVRGENGGLKKVSTQKTIDKVISWKQRRKEMKGVCKSCHGIQQIENFYKQFDSLVVTYNEKFAKPAQRLYGMAKEDGLVKGSTFHSDLGWHWWELWHHEGRRARHGASMMGPDYTHWHGMYEVAENFYFKFLPELMKLAEEHGMIEKYEKEVGELMARPEHKWREEGFSADILESIKEEQERRYED
ncbi:MAG: multiheme c-type cytochrome [Desulfurivibrionaceae bacterium]